MEYVDVFVTRSVDKLELVCTSMLVVPADVWINVDVTGQRDVDVSTITVVITADSAGAEELATPTALDVGCSVHLVQTVLVDVRKTVDVVRPTDVSTLVVPAVVCVFVDVTGHVVIEVSTTTVVITSLGSREVEDSTMLAEEL